MQQCWLAISEVVVFQISSTSDTVLPMCLNVYPLEPIRSRGHCIMAADGTGTRAGVPSGMKCTGHTKASSSEPTIGLEGPRPPLPQVWQLRSRTRTRKRSHSPMHKPVARAATIGHCSEVDELVALGALLRLGQLVLALQVTVDARVDDLAVAELELLLTRAKGNGSGQIARGGRRLRAASCTRK
jgi:hypothetical protein